MHKLFHVSKKKISALCTKFVLLLNIPTAAAAVALIVIVNVVMRGASVPIELYRTVFYAVDIFVAYSFVICFLNSLICGHMTEAHGKYTYIEISDGSLVISQHEKTVYGLFDSEEYVRMWLVKLSDVEDVYSDKGCLFIKSPARLFVMPERWLRYIIDDSGKICFEHPWNEDFGGEKVDLVKIKDYYPLGERILKRILFCAEKSRITEKRRAEFREKMLSIAKRSNRKKGLTQKYKEPRIRGPREGIKNRNW